MRARPNRFRRRVTAALVSDHLPDAAAGSVLLTFDDGPTPGVTEQVLTRLERFDARAIFFVVGKLVASAPALTGEVAAAGHAVGNHSDRHADGRFPEPLGFLRDMARCSERIRAATGRPAAFYRAPAGRLHPASLFGPPLLRMRHLLWSLDSNDWRCTTAREARDTARRVLAEVRGGDIVLLHEFAASTGDLLDDLLPGLADRGFDLGGGLAAIAGRNGGDGGSALAGECGGVV
jgi:peptidoglycan/xylan/chitin deacetylase (PgdA/CDA1 family)